MLSWLRTLRALFASLEEENLRDRQRQVFLTCHDASKVNHSHFKPFMDQFQRDAQQQLHHQVAHNMLHTRQAEEGNEQNILDEW